MGDNVSIHTSALRDYFGFLQKNVRAQVAKIPLGMFTAFWP